MRTMSRISSSDLPAVVGDAAAGWAGAAAAGAGCAAAGACATGPCTHEASVRDAATNDANTVILNKRFIVAPRFVGTGPLALLRRHAKQPAWIRVLQHPQRAVATHLHGAWKASMASLSDA